MRVLLDACVLYPTVLREILLGCAERGLLEPLWSARILEEWRRASARNGEADAARAGVEIALLRARWPAAEVPPDTALEATLDLPDPSDRHVLAAAVTGAAEVLLTLNLRDFPHRALARHGVLRRDPEGLLAELHEAAPEVVGAAVGDALSRSAADRPLRTVLKRAGLPRLARRLASG